ncbi:9508_t:CDS:2, partial [Racocetra persica]
MDKGFTFDDARLAFERDNTTVNPLTTNKTEEHAVLTHYGLSLYFHRELDRARAMRHTEDNLAELRRMINLLNTFATAEA